MGKAKFLFGDIVVVNKDEIGVVVKTWFKSQEGTYQYDIYNRGLDRIEQYLEHDVERYRVRHKYLNCEELEYQREGMM